MYTMERKLYSAVDTHSAEGDGWRPMVHRFLWQHNSLISCWDVRAATRLSVFLMDDGGVTQAESRQLWRVFSLQMCICDDVLCCVICRMSLAVLPEWRLVPRGETRAFLHVSWTSPSQWIKHIYTLCPTHKPAHTKINTMSVLHTPPSTLYRSLWGLKHGNPISFFFPLEKTCSMKHVGICLSSAA